MSTKPMEETSPMSADKLIARPTSPQSTHAPSAHSPAIKPLGSPSTQSHSSGWTSLFGWLVVGGLGVAGWYYQPQWLPQVKTWLGMNKPATTKPARVVPVSTAVVKKRDMPLYLNGLGTVTAFKSVTIRSRVEGELIKVAFSEGQMVHEGDLLAEIDPRPFEVQLNQAEGQLARDQATVKTAKTTLSRYEGLASSKSIAAQQVDDQVSIVQQTMAMIQTDEATVANAQLQLTYCRITAPISGRIGLRLVDQGNIVRANDPTGLAVITQLQPIALVFTIPQDDIARVQKRSNSTDNLVVDAFDRDFKVRLASGKLLAIDNQVDATTGTVRIKAEFANEDGMLFPNQFVNARLLVDNKRDAIVVPSAAVQRGPTSMYVYVVKEDETVELRNVVPGPTEAAETSIESGLEAGEMVVTDGLDKLQPGAKISSRKKEKGAAGDKGESKPEKAATAPDKHTDVAPRSPADAPAKSSTAPSADPGPSPATAEQNREKTAITTDPASSASDSRSKPVPSCGEENSENKDNP
ncbi:MAG TPA: MdtA/MuxA family multidrug efflux RND transporter periplasmic adaptor subunit [Schlesneria sp.]